MELDGDQGAPRDAGSGLLQGSPLSPVLFGLTCGRILKELPEGRSYVDDCAWTVAFGAKNELASKVRKLLDQAQSAFRKHCIELDETRLSLHSFRRLTRRESSGKSMLTGGQCDV
jgi:hypothetical protein